MKLLLDTNTVSELVKPRPEPRVITWFTQLDEDDVYLSVAMVAEIRRGIEVSSDQQRRQALQTWLDEELLDRFAGRLLAIDRHVAEQWGVIVARGRRLGLTVGVMDGFFAATAEVHDLTLATRSVRHFASLGISVVSPWDVQG